MKELRAIKSVYCYYFPEIRKLIDDLTKEFPHEIFLKSIFPKLDDFHFPIIEKYIRFHSQTLPGLENFKHRYPTNGSSEGIFHFLVSLKVNSPGVTVYAFKGEYEGYKNYANDLKLNFVEVDLREDPKKLKKGTWLISNPSAINGNIISNYVINKICEAGHEVALDCSYVGLTKPYKFDISHKNIVAIFTSFSKPFGLFYYRIGFLFSKRKIDSLEGNIWFKNLFSLLIADKILSETNPEYFYKKYRPVQEKIIENINKEFSLRLRPSDVLILGFMDSYGLSKEAIDTVESFKRGEYYRFCLTPYFLEKEGRI